MSARADRLGAAERPDRREPDRRPAGRRPQRPRRDSQPRRPPDAGRARRRDRPRLPRGARRCARTAGAHRRGVSRPAAAVANRRIADRSRRCDPSLGSPCRRSRAGKGCAGVICLFSDLTAVVELEEQLRLKETLARLGELTAGIAHEFRNGLATIHGYSRLIGRCAPAGVPAVRRGHPPGNRGARADRDELPELRAPGTGGVSQPSISAPRPARGRRSRARAAGRHLDRGDGAFGIVDGDEVLLRQVFGNLVRNAAEACDGGRRAADRRLRADGRAHRAACRSTTTDPAFRRRHAANASSSRSSPRARAAPAWAWPSSRRSW